MLPPPPLAAAGPAKRLMSAIVVNGQTRMLRKAVRMVFCHKTPSELVASVALLWHILHTMQSDEAADVQQQDDYNAFKRPAPRDAEQNPAAQKRARRMFGALMGTLAKARFGLLGLLPKLVAHLPRQIGRLQQD